MDHHLLNVIATMISLRPTLVGLMSSPSLKSQSYLVRLPFLYPPLIFRSRRRSEGKGGFQVLLAPEILPTTISPQIRSGQCYQATGGTPGDGLKNAPGFCCSDHAEPGSTSLGGHQPWRSCVVAGIFLPGQQDQSWSL